MSEAHAAHTVLVVDDDHDTLTALAFYLDAHGFAVEATTSARAALHRLRSGLEPCAIVLDIAMPDFGGWDLLEAMRADPAMARLAVVVYSGTQPDQARADRLRVGVYFLKPTQPDVIAAALVGHCPRGQLRTPADAT